MVVLLLLEDGNNIKIREVNSISLIINSELTVAAELGASSLWSSHIFRLSSLLIYSHQ